LAATPHPRGRIAPKEQYLKADGYRRKILRGARPNSSGHQGGPVSSRLPSAKRLCRYSCQRLSNPDLGWRRRLQFSGVTKRIAQTLVEYCADPSLAVRVLEKVNVKPNALQFFRSLGYQVADLYPPRNRRAIKNLVQSVYAHCELQREGARGTYWGTRISELLSVAVEKGSPALLMMPHGDRGRPTSTPAQSGRTRRRNRGKPARPYIWRFNCLRRWTCPSTCPFLQDCSMPAKTAA
jgi:hypothetical protein